MSSVLRFVGVMALLGVAGVVWLSSFSCRGGSRTFDAAVWKEERGQRIHDGERLRMVGDLLRLLEKERPSRARVIEMLGQPDADPTTASCLSWWLGMWIDVDTLDVYFDARGQFTRAMQVQH